MVVFLIIDNSHPQEEAVMSTFTLVYFTGTGNTEMVARVLAAHLGDASLYAIEDLLSLRAPAPDLTGTSRLVLLYPVYAFDAPPIVYRFLKRLSEWVGGKSSLPAAKAHKSAAIITVPCDPHRINSAAAVGVKRRLSGCGYQVAYEEQVVMPSNFFTPYPDSWNRSLVRGADKKTAAIAEELQAGVERSLSPGVLAFTARFLGKMEHLGDNFFGKDLRAGKECTLCGACSSGCPVGNIRIKGGQVRFGWSCIMCMRCIYRCPKEAIMPRLYRFTVMKGGYDPRRFDVPGAEDGGGPRLPERFEKYLE
jgi:NAD-dependent dihydropyrimidine dehydrogenase PreA subunit